MRYERIRPPAPRLGHAPSPQRPRAVLPALCATQITSWGVLYYAFPIVLPDITADTGWSSAAVTAAFSAALLVSAAVGIPVGRFLDRNGPRAVMTGGSVLALCALLALANAPTFAGFCGAWLVMGAAMAAVFYQPAFAAVTRWWAEDRVKALTAITLTGGLAPTVFSPLTAALVGSFGWRTTYAVLALILAAVTVPAHALALRAPWPPAPGPAQPPGRPGQPGVARSRPFLLLTCALSLSGFTVWAVLIGLAPLMTERGASTSVAAWALGLCGVGQTLGRVLYSFLARRTGVTARTVALIAGAGISAAALGMVPGPLWLLIALAVLAGMVRGNLTLLQATAVSDRWGAGDYGRLSALLAAPATIIAAVTPFAAVTLAGQLGGYSGLFTALAFVSAVAAALASTVRCSE